VYRTALPAFWLSHAGGLSPRLRNPTGDGNPPCLPISGKQGINLETVGMIFGRDPGVAYPHVRPYGSAKPRPAPGRAVAHPRFVSDLV
jgi:hypothetical protein